MVVLTVVSAKLARIFDSFKVVQDPFVAAELDSSPVGCTRAHKHGNLAPCWGETIDLKKDGRQLALRVFINHRLRRSTFCGEAYVDLRQVPIRCQEQLCLTLRKRGKPTGILVVQFPAA